MLFFKYYVEWLLLQSFDYLPAQSLYQESFGYNCYQEEKNHKWVTKKTADWMQHVLCILVAHALGPIDHGSFFSVCDQYCLQELNFQELPNRLYKKTNHMKS